MLNNNLNELLAKYNYICEQRYENNQLNRAYNYYIFLDTMGSNLVQNESNIDIESLLYSKYYWFTKIMKYHRYQYGKNVSVEQQQFKLLEELDHELSNGIDISIIQGIETQVTNEGIITNDI